MSKIDLTITEGKSSDLAEYSNSTVRVFLDNDYTYGYWVSESELYSLLPTDIQSTYYTQSKFKVPAYLANAIVKLGYSIYPKKFFKE